MVITESFMNYSHSDMFIGVIFLIQPDSALTVLGLFLIRTLNPSTDLEIDCQKL